jgi:hypothetical protein
LQLDLNTTDVVPPFPNNFLFRDNAKQCLTRTGYQGLVNTIRATPGYGGYALGTGEYVYSITVHCSAVAFRKCVSANAILLQH